jgi:hypothetical protein
MFLFKQIKNKTSLFEQNGFIYFVLPAILITIMVVTRFNSNYLIFHLLAEFFAIFVALSIAFVAYFTYPYTKNNYLLFLGLGYFWIGLLDLMHSMSFPGMQLFQVEGANTTLTIWVLTRLLEALILLIAPFMR